MKELINTINCIRDVRPCDGQVLKATNNAAILSSISSHVKEAPSERDNRSVVDIGVHLSISAGVYVGDRGRNQYFFK